MNLQNNIDPACHADTLRDMAEDHLIAGNGHTADALLAGANTLETLARTVAEQDETIQTLSRLLADAEEAAIERAEQIDRVRHALSSIARVRSESEASARDDDEIAEWHEATADALEYVIHLLTAALEGGTK